MPADITLNSGSGGAIIATDPTTSSEHYQLIKLAQGAVGTFTLVTSANPLPVVIGSSFQGGIHSLSSQITVTATGPVTVTSGTITSTAATNPWSSAPAFNLPVVNVSSGAVQISGIPSVLVSTFAYSGVAVATTVGDPVLVTSSGGPVFSAGVNTAAGYGPVTSSAGRLASLSSGTVTLSSVHTLFSASSGGIQAFFPISPTSSVAGAGFGPVTSSAGVLASLSSGTVSLSSQLTVTATAGTNPWSSAPGFNVPVVSVSSGLVQISGTPLVNLVGTSSALATVTSSGGLSVTIVSGAVGSTAVNVVGSAAFAPVTSSAGVLASLSSGTVSLSSQITVTATGPVTVTSGLISVTSGTITSTAATNPWSSAPGFNVPVVTVSSGFIRAFPVGAITTSGLSAFHRMTTGGVAVNVITTAASSLYGYAIFNSSAVPRTTKFYNSTAPTIGGSTANLILSVQAPGSTGGGGANLTLPVGLYSSNGWSCIITAGMGDTDTGAPGTNDISCGVFYQT